jgi:hypothetical protein
MRTASFCSALYELRQQGIVHKQSQGYELASSSAPAVSPLLPRLAEWRVLALIEFMHA